MDVNCRIAKVPKVVFHRILHFLSCRDQHLYTRLSRQFQREMPFDFKLILLDQLTTGRPQVSERHNLLRRILPHIGDALREMRLNVSGRDGVTFEDLKLISNHCHSLTSIYMPWSNFPIFVVSSLPCLRNLTVYNFTYDTKSASSTQNGSVVNTAPDISITPESMQGLLGLAKMDNIVVRGFTCDALRVVSQVQIDGMRKLVVNLRGSSDLRQQDVASMCAYFSNLEFLRFNRLNKFHYLNRHISQLHRLQTLVIAYSFFDDISENFQLPQALTKLHLEQCGTIGSPKLLQNLVNLRTLFANTAGFTTKVLAELPHSAPLVDVDISFTEAVCDETLNLLIRKGFRIQRLVAADNIRSFSSLKLRWFCQGSAELKDLNVSYQREIDDSVLLECHKNMQKCCQIDVSKTACSVKGLEGLCCSRIAELQNMDSDQLPIIQLRFTFNIMDPHIKLMTRARIKRLSFTGWRPNNDLLI